MLKPQPNTWVVRQNLLLDRYFGAEVVLFPDNATRTVALGQLLAADRDAYFIPTGGSTRIGALGYVNAAFELREQINKGVMPQPDVIYLPVGSCGTTAGLLLGLALAQLPIKIVAVGVEPEETPDEFAVTTRNLFREANQLLNSLSPSVPLVAFPEDQFKVTKDFCGPEYGAWIPEGDAATTLMLETEDIVTEGTYSAKPIAALCADIKNGVRSNDEVILLWNTYCGADFSHITKTVDYKCLNTGVHKYFKEL
jgi:D-cysteine desulfhydrase